MTTTAILFLVLSALVIWGGLATSIALLRRDARLLQDGPDDDDAAPEVPRDL